MTRITDKEWAHLKTGNVLPKWHLPARDDSLSDVGSAAPLYRAGHAAPQGARPILASEQRTNDMSIQQAMTNTPEKHRATLFGERVAGSKWGRSFTQADWDALLGTWEQFTPADGASMDGCRYFQAPIGNMFPDATLGAIPFHEVPVPNSIRVVEGAHGPELQCPELPSGAHVLCFKWATLILGEHEGAQIVFTIHPGEPLAPWDGRMAGERMPLVQAGTAVKLAAE